MMNKLNSKKLISAVMLAMIFASGIYLIAADHADAPAVTGKTSDITDVYAFQSPTTASNMVLVVNIRACLLLRLQLRPSLILKQ